MNETTQAYWDSYYKTKEKASSPSQFATFVLNEFSDKSRFIDIGCGDGRDSLFFASYEMDVLGLDGCPNAIKLCQNIAQERGLSNAHFDQLDIGDAHSCNDFAAAHSQEGDDTVVYARFFLHAIDEKAQLNFLKLASSLMGTDGHLCLEFRTPRDEFQTKVTSTHYRRYVDPLDLISQAGHHNLKPIYLVEGFGYAKYKVDDAYVARMILKKND